MTGNWNSGCTGLMRYAVWQVPVLAWLVAEALDGERDRLRILSGVVVPCQALFRLVAALVPGYVTDHLAHNVVARFALDRYPRLYTPVAEVFAERTLGKEGRIPPVTVYSAGGAYRKALVARKKLRAFRASLGPGTPPRIRMRAGRDTCRAARCTNSSAEAPSLSNTRASLTNAANCPSVRSRVTRP